jgi:hypothetical protein
MIFGFFPNEISMEEIPLGKSFKGKYQFAKNN